MRKVDDTKKFAQMLSMSRAAAKKSQEFMSLEMGVSNKTIRNWEAGVTAPSMLQTFQWFRVLQVNPMNYILKYVYPNLDKPRKDKTPDETRELLFELLSSMPIDTIEQLIFIFSGVHGSSPKAVIDLLTAHLQTDMRCRVWHAGAIIQDYELACEKGEINCPNEALPDVELLKKAHMRGRDAVLSNMFEYSMH